MAIVSLTFICVTLWVCDFLRQQISGKLPMSIARSVIIDFLVSVEMCTAALEMGALLDHYGHLLWTICLFLNAVYQIIRWRDHAMPR